MHKLGWMLFQAAVAAPVYYFCAVTLEGQGMAPALVAMFVAFIATLSVSWLFDRLRALRIRHKANSKIGRPPPIPWSPSESTQHPGRIVVGEYRRKLT